MLATWIARVIQQNTEGFDHLIDVFHKPVVSFMERHPTLRAVLDGSWLGHPLHPAIIPIPIGAFTMGLVLDYVGIFIPSPGFYFATDVLYAFGLAMVVPALITGLTEWSTTEGGAKRVAFVHAASNLVAGGFIGGSLLLRAVGLRGFGIVASTTGYGVLLFGALLGGELSFTYAVGVQRHAAESARSDQ